MAIQPIKVGDLGILQGKKCREKVDRGGEWGEIVVHLFKHDVWKAVIFK